MMNNIYIIGVGLIGGSLALDIKELNKNAVIYGVDKNEKHLEEAIELGVIDKKSSIEDLKNADLVVVSIPVDATVQELNNILDAISDTTLVIDVGSTKEDICKIVENHPRRRNFFSDTSYSWNRIFRA